MLEGNSLLVQLHCNQTLHFWPLTPGIGDESEGSGGEETVLCSILAIH